MQHTAFHFQPTNIRGVVWSLAFILILSLRLSNAYSQQQLSRLSPPHIPVKVTQLIHEHCGDCHQDDQGESHVDLFNLKTLNQTEQNALLNRIQNQLFFDLMPPADYQPVNKKATEALFKSVQALLRTRDASELDEKTTDAEHGNYVDHQALFDGSIQAAAYTPSRRWLISPSIFEERVTHIFELSGRDLEQARQNGFYGVTNPFVLPDHSGVRDYDTTALNGGHLLVMLDNAKWIADKQLIASQISLGLIDPKQFPNPKDRWYPKTTPAEFKQIIESKNHPTEQEISSAVTKQFQLVLQRDPKPEELDKYANLTIAAIEQGGNTLGLRQMLVAVLLESEFLYRMEIGSGPVDAEERKLLSPHEAAFAISYALGDRGPDDELLAAARDGRLVSREDYQKQVSRLLADTDYYRGPIGQAWGSRDKIPPRITSHPKLVRFFREFFGYPAALKVFKDLKRSSGFYVNPGRGSNQTPGHLVNEADRVVAGIVETDTDVFNQLLTTDRFYLYHNRDNETGEKLIANWKTAYEVLKDTNWREDPEGVVAAHDDLIKQYLDPRGINPRSKVRHDNSLIRFMTHFEHTFGQGNRPFTTMPWAHGNHYWHSPIYSLPRTPGRSGYGNQDNFDYEPVQPFAMPNRKGILTHPAWLVAHSGNFATDPIRRGKWIREKLLAGMVPEIPITVDAQIPEDPHRTLRERLEIATADSQCWKCHQKMNPLGLPFENFDDFGRFRTGESLEYEEQLIKRMPGNEADLFNTKPIDTAGYLEGTDNESLDGPVTDSFDLIDRLAKSDRVRQSIIRHAFRFFMGRNEMLSDSQTLIDADQAYLTSGGSFKAVVISLLCSDSFRYRKVIDTPMHVSVLTENRVTQP
ncbi:MAG: DUF1588 domain-containing protein [Rubripirellula sp.]